MTTVIVRYGCDGSCGRYFEDKNDLIEVDVQQWRGRGGSGEPFYTTKRTELLCHRCFADRDVRSGKGG